MSSWALFLDMVGCIITEVSNGTLLGMGAVYAKSIGFNVAQISVFMSVAILGGMLLQWPIGVLCDRFFNHYKYYRK